MLLIVSTFTCRVLGPVEEVDGAAGFSGMELDIGMGGIDKGSVVKVGTDGTLSVGTLGLALAEKLSDGIVLGDSGGGVETPTVRGADVVGGPEFTVAPRLNADFLAMDAQTVQSP